MKRLEIIHLRLATGCSDDLIADIQRSASASIETSNIEIYQHAGVTTDLGIHILHDTDDAGELPSPLGVVLSSALREYGMVEHSVWIEKKEKVL